MAVKSKAKGEIVTEIDVLEITKGMLSFCIIGREPLLLNRFAMKAMRDLLLPRGRLSDAEKKTRLKHDPNYEFRQSVYTHYGDDEPTRLCFPASGVKSAICSAALRAPGTTKTEIGQLTWVPGRTINLYGAPLLYMAPVRSSDINRTPDIRTRAILPQWAAYVTVKYVKPNLTAKTITSLMAWAGTVAGLGDNRQEKTHDSFGQFDIVREDDPEFLDIVRNGGRTVQDAALAAAEPYDGESAALLDWYMEEVVRRDRVEKTSDDEGEEEKKTGARGRRRGRRSNGHVEEMHAQ